MSVRAELLAAELTGTKQKNEAETSFLLTVQKRKAHYPNISLKRFVPSVRGIIPPEPAAVSSPV